MKSVRTSLLTLAGSLLLMFVPFSTGTAQVKKSSFLTRVTVKESRSAWARFTPANESFAVSMPQDPRIQQEVRVIGDQQLLLSYYGVRRGESVYAVLTVEGLNDANFNVAQMLLLELFGRTNAAVFPPQGAQGSTTIKATFEKNVLLDGYVGRRYSLETYGKTGEWRLFKVDNTFYAVAASANSNHEPSLKRFFDSFTFSASKNKSITAAVNAPVGERVTNPTNRWLIILQTFSKNERVRATQRMNLLRSRGYDGHVVSTDSYPNLRPGLLILAMGPYSKRAAEERLGMIRLFAPQSYIKPGW
jgi:hypothetical protein